MGEIGKPSAFKGEILLKRKDNFCRFERYGKTGSGKLGLENIRTDGSLLLLTRFRDKRGESVETPRCLLKIKRESIATDSISLDSPKN